MRILRILPLLTALTLAGCADAIRQSAAGLFRAGTATRYVGREWNPKKLRLECPAGGCPAQVGALLFAATVDRDRSGQPTKFRIERCTATLIAADLILTNAHCIVANADGYFVLPSGVARVKAIATETDVPFRAFPGWSPTPPGQPRQSLWGPDVAVLALTEALAAPIPLAVATAATPSAFDQLRIFVSNDGSNDNTYRIDSLECSIKPRAQFPFAMSENPDVILGFGCAAIEGNSGGPMFAAGRPEIQAVLQAKGEGYVIASNLRCQPLTDAGRAACVKVDAKAMDQRIDRQRAAGKALAETASEVKDGEFETRFVRDGLPLKIPNGEAYEVVSTPTCREADRLTQVRFPSELIDVNRDDDANPKAAVRERRVSVGRVIEQIGDRVRVEMTWAPPFGILEHEKQHPRAFRGRVFSIDLPRCPR